MLDRMPKKLEPVFWMIWRVMMVIAVGVTIGFGWLW